MKESEPEHIVFGNEGDISSIKHGEGQRHVNGKRRKSVCRLVEKLYRL